VRCRFDIDHNQFIGISPGSDAIDIDWNPDYAPPHDQRISHNLILGVAGDGIDLGSASPTIEGNLVFQCSDKGISIGEASHPLLLNNVIAWCDVGVAIKDSSDPRMAFNTVHGCRVGLDAYQKTPGFDGGLGQFEHGILSENKTQVRVDSLSMPRIRRCVVYPASPILKGPDLILSDPMFIDPLAGNLKPRPDAPVFGESFSSGPDIPPNPVDILGNQRPQAGGVALGPFEDPSGSGDLDLDGIPDETDPFPFFPDTGPDHDLDGLPDAWEEEWLGGTGFSGNDDPDQDNMNNSREWLHGRAPADPADGVLRINEIHYAPGPGDIGGTFVEIINTSDQQLDIGGYHLSGSAVYTFPPGATLAPGALAVVAEKPIQLALARGMPIPFGPLESPLPIDREWIHLLHPRGATIDVAAFDFTPPWPDTPNEEGPSLERLPGTVDGSTASAWAASTIRFGTPGRPNTTTAGGLCINELFAHPEDDSTDQDWIELFNPGSELVQLYGLGLTDDRRLDHRYAFPPGAEIGPGKFLVIDRDALEFGLDSSGEYLALYELASRRILSELDFPQQPAGVSYARTPDASNSWAFFPDPSPDEPNPAPPATPAVVISEIMYHPVEGDAHEFLELLNLEDYAVPLEGWRFTRGVRYSFPAETVMEPMSRILVANDPETLLADAPNLDPDLVFGPFDGTRLSNRGETLKLVDQNGNTVSSVRYADRGPWSRKADGEGASLEWTGTARDQTGLAFWSAGEWSGGTPGRGIDPENPRFPAFLANVRHRPLQPRTDEPVTIFTRAEGIESKADDAIHVRYRSSYYAPWSTTIMERDPSIPDGWSAQLDGMPSDTLVEFYLEAVGNGVISGVYPPGAPSFFSRQTGSPITRSLLFLATDAPADEPLTQMRICITDRNWLELNVTRPVTSDELLDCTLVTPWDVHYGARIRFRGNLKRYKPIKSFRIDLRESHPFRSENRLNFNGWNPTGEALATRMFALEGFATLQLRDVRLRKNEDFIGPTGHFLLAERPGGEMFERYAPDAAESESWEGWGEIHTDEDSVEYPPALEPVMAAMADPTRHLTTLPQLIDQNQWLHWLAVTSFVADDETILNNVSGNHLSFQRSPGEIIELHPLDLDSAWRAAAANIHPLPETDEVPTATPGLVEWLLNPTIRRDYYQQIAELITSVDSRWQTDIIHYFEERGFSSMEQQRALDFLDGRKEYLAETLADYISGTPVPEDPRGLEFDDTFAAIPGGLLDGVFYGISEAPRLWGTVLAGSDRIEIKPLPGSVSLLEEPWETRWQWQGEAVNGSVEPHEIDITAYPLHGGFSPPAPAVSIQAFYLQGDSDQDGAADGIELRLGFDPLDPMSTPFRLVFPPELSDQWSMRFLAWPEAAFIVEFSTDLMQWQPAFGWDPISVDEDQVIDLEWQDQWKYDWAFFRLRMEPRMDTNGHE
jgi:parallel beta-helix repeat protein